jgi:hypothetical protein
VGCPFVWRATISQFASRDESLDTARSARPAKGRFADIATPLGSAANAHERVGDRLLVHGSQRIVEVRGGAHLEAKPFPALIDGIPSNLCLPRSTRFGVGYACVPPAGEGRHGDRGRGSTTGRHRAGIGPAPRWSLPMSHDLALARSHALDLARTLMVPVVLFRSGTEFGVLPADELDEGDDVEVLAEYDPWRAH